MPVRVKGADRLASTLDRAAKDLGELDAAEARAGSIIAGEAGRRAPRLSGRLAGSITPRVDRGNVLTLESDLVYAPVIHNGWPAHNIRANPFLADAVEATHPQWMPVYVDGVQAILDTVKGV